MLEYVGKSIKREESYEKVQGKALYPDDIEYPDMLYAGVVRSKIPFGKVINIDYLKAKKLKGIVNIIDYSMIPGERMHGVVLKDQPILVKDIVKRVGDPIVLVVAENKSILKEAISLIDVKYEEYNGIFTIEDAMKEESQLIGEDSNILYDLKIKRGNVEKGFKEAKYIAEKWYKTPAIDHAFMQPEAAICKTNEDGVIEVYVATQYPHYDREEVANCLGLSQDKIRIINTSIGGAFGAREDITLQAHAALACYYSKRPVKIVYTREESTVTHCKRHGIKMYYKTGVREDGTLCAVKARIYGDTGAYCSWGMNVLRKAAVHAVGPYEVENVDIESFAVYTNNSFSGAMRGFGAAQAAIAYESQMDILARMLNINPLAFRYLNAVKDGSIMPSGQCLSRSVGIKECIKRIAALENIEL